jgi:UDP-N-acetyl-D-glucosamine dehydrogenase
MDKEFAGRVADREAKIAVVGLGYVGMPLAMAYAASGFKVIGYDIAAERVAELAAGKSYLMDVPATEIGKHVREGRFLPTTEPAKLGEADVVFVCVPTPFDRAKAPDLSFIESASRTLAKHLRRGQLVLLESTTYPGTTQEVMVPILEESGFVAGRDFFVAFSPERIDPGNRTFTIANTSKVVGGIDTESTERAALVLEQVIREGKVHRVSNPRAAELTKLLENTFRAVNIALVNELAMLCDRMGIDIWEVIEAAKTKPYGFMPFYPGPGVGGHCIPVDPYYLSWKAREFDFSTKFIEIAAETNIGMPFFTVEKLRRALRGRGKSLAAAKILVLGAAFKKDIDDARNSSAIRVMEILRWEGADVSYHDPYVGEIRVSEGIHREHDGGPVRLRSAALDDTVLASVDCVVILVAHSGIDYGRVLARARFVFDAVNATRGAAQPNLVRL